MNTEGSPERGLLSEGHIVSVGLSWFIDCPEINDEGATADRNNSLTWWVLVTHCKQMGISVNRC